MQPPVDIVDRSDYKEQMNDLLRVDPERVVILTIDMQRDYLDASIASSPAAPDEAARVLRGARALLAFARDEGIPVIHVYVRHRAVEVEKGLEGSARVRMGRLSRLTQNAQAPSRSRIHRLEGSPNAEVPAELVGPEDIHVTTKKSLDGFFGTDLDVLLAQVYRPEVVVVTGINTETCVYSTMLSAQNRGYLPIVISDAVLSTRGKDHNWMALELMARTVAWVLTVDEFKAKVAEGRQRFDVRAPSVRAAG